MKNALLLSSLIFSTVSFAYDYDCKLMSDHRDTVKIQVTSKSMTKFDQYDGNGSGRIGKVVFSNEGIVGGNGKMKDRLSFVVDYRRSEVMPGEVTEFFLSPELINGGFKLRNGSIGGYMTFAGHGYSYETYICFLEK